MYKHQVQWYGANLSELGGGELGWVGAPPGTAMLRAEGRKCWC